MAAAANFSVRDALGGLVLPRQLRDSGYLAPQPDLLAAALALLATMTAVLGTKVRQGTSSSTRHTKYCSVALHLPLNYTLSAGCMSSGRSGRGGITGSVGDGRRDGPGGRRPPTLDGRTRLPASRSARGEPQPVYFEVLATFMVTSEKN